MKRRISELTVLFILGLIPLLWFGNHQIILGHDSGLTLSPLTHFLDRLYIWTERFGFGQDQTYALPGFIIHGIEALLYSLGFGLQTVQKITFIFWFVLPGITMYVFASWLSKKIELKNLALPASVFYMVNHFLLQGWFIAERTKFSLYAALPLIMLFLFQWEEKKRSTLKTSLYISVTILFLNGGASFPLFGGIFVCIFVYAIFYFYRNRSFSSILSIAKLAIITLLISAVLNAYWLFPLLNFVQNTYSQVVGMAGGVGGVLTWVNTISQDASLINLFRLQGVPEWYQNPLHPYASAFLNNRILIFVSYLLPLLAFSSLFFARKKKYKLIIFFVSLALISMIFVGGSHPPFGAIYIFLVNFVPGFIAFRTPFYKFAPALWFAYAILISFTFTLIIEERIKNIIIVSAGIILFCVGLVLYSFPFLSGSFFDYMKDERTTRVTVPEYIFEFREWADQIKWTDSKLLSLPPSNRENKIEAYDWGYWSVSPLTSLITNAPIVNRAGMSMDELEISDHLFEMMKENDPGWKSLAEIMGINMFLVKKDYIHDAYGSFTDSWQDYTKSLNNLNLTEDFGKWGIYELDRTENQTINMHIISGKPSDIGVIASLPVFESNDLYLVEGQLNDSDGKIQKFLSNYYIVPRCIRCNLQYEYINRDLYRPLITQGSFLYPYIENKNMMFEKTLSGTEAIDYYTYKSLEQILAFDRVVIEKRALDTIPSILSEYNRIIGKLNEFVRSELLARPGENNDILLRVLNVFRIEDDIIFTNASKITDKKILNQIDQIYSKVNGLREFIKSNVWQTTEEERKKLLFDVKKDGQYELYYKPHDELIESEITYYLDGKQKLSTVEKRENNWIYLGKEIFKSGAHRLEIYQPINNKYTKGDPVVITSTGAGSCYKSNIIEGNPGEVFRISFEHRRISGSKKFYVKVLPAEFKPNLLDTTDVFLNSNTFWSGHETDYQSIGIDSRGFYLAVCNSPQIDETYTSQIEIRNIKIRKIAVPEVVAVQKNEGKVFSKADAQKINQTKYIVNSNQTNEGIFILNQSVNNNWGSDNSEVVKLEVNGYQNAWIIPKGIDKVTISYYAQKYVKIGFIVSGISLFSALIYILLSVIKKIK